MDNAEKIANALGGAKRNGNAWMCKCPCHEDRTASLSVDFNGDKPLFYCHAGCDFVTIKKALIDRGIIAVKPTVGVTKGHRSSSATSNGPTPKPRIHTYHNADGSYCFEKVKGTDGKWSSRIRNNDGSYNHSVKSITIKPLYNLPKIIETVAQGGTVYVTEGEKDADTLNRLGLHATTTHSSSQWLPEHTATLKGAGYVIIIRDNDEPGKKIAEVRLKKIRSVIPNSDIVAPPDVNGASVKDITDYFDGGGTLDGFIEASSATIEQGGSGEGDAGSGDNDGGQENPTRDQYYKVFSDFFGPTKRCIFSDDLVYFDNHSALWSPALNKIRPLRSQIREITRTGRTKFKAPDVEDHLCALENSLTPQLVLDIPQWDHVDRINTLAERLILKESPADSGIDQNTLKEMLKGWHAKIWARLYDPTIRNEIFILSGPQNIGKDYWIRENLGALGQYLVNFSIHSNERDTKEQLHRGLVMNISEFDRTSRSEVSLLKEIVTATQTDLRFAYDRRAMTRPCRCSFIASTNVNDIFNDPTGHSRYVFFEITDIERGTRFSENDKLQVLAQGQWLAKQGFKADELAVKAMEYQIQDNTPDDEYEVIEERWDYLAGQYYYSLGHVDRDQYSKIKGDLGFSGFLPNNIINDIIVKIARDFDKSPKKVRATLKMRHRQLIHKTLGRGYYFKTLVQGFPGQEYEV